MIDKEKERKHNERIMMSKGERRNERRREATYWQKQERLAQYYRKNCKAQPLRRWIYSEGKNPEKTRLDKFIDENNLEFVWGVQDTLY